MCMLKFQNCVKPKLAFQDVVFCLVISLGHPTTSRPNSAGWWLEVKDPERVWERIKGSLIHPNLIICILL